MAGHLNQTAKQVLENAKSILLIDWPSQEIPRALLKAGFTVIGYSPDKYSAIELDQDNNEQLIFRKLDTAPRSVDIVNVFRPESEHAAIITKRVLPLTATALWLHPPVTSAKTAKLAKEHGLIFVEGCDIADIARTITGS